MMMLNKAADGKAVYIPEPRHIKWFYPSDGGTGLVFEKDLTLFVTQNCEEVSILMGEGVGH